MKRNAYQNALYNSLMHAPASQLLIPFGWPNSSLGGSSYMYFKPTTNDLVESGVKIYNACPENLNF